MDYLMDYQIYKTKAVSHLKTADHLLTMTYPMVNDTKLLKLILSNLISFKKNIVSYIAGLHGGKDGPDEPSLRELKDLFLRTGMNTGYLGFINELSVLDRQKRESGVEFIRKEKFVFASDDYELSFLTEKHLRELIVKGKLFLKEVMGQKND